MGGLRPPWVPGCGPTVGAVRRPEKERKSTLDGLSKRTSRREKVPEGPCWGSGRLVAFSVGRSRWECPGQCGAQGSGIAKHGFGFGQPPLGDLGRIRGEGKTSISVRP